MCEIFFSRLPSRFQRNVRLRKPGLKADRGGNHVTHPTRWRKSISMPRFFTQGSSRKGRFSPQTWDGVTFSKKRTLTASAKKGIKCVEEADRGRMRDDSCPAAILLPKHLKERQRVTNARCQDRRQPHVDQIQPRLHKVRGKPIIFARRQGSVFASPNCEPYGDDDRDSPRLE